ncbi:MAG: HlyD family efflux transporter periplasmic adaptor subunit [Herbinix sp.]|nr:HlyD family efflux transporter periplasmic adaptor subunit [Herbinix sp.]
MKKINFNKLKVRKIITRVLILAVIVIAGFSFFKRSTPAQETMDIMTSSAIIGKVESVISGTGTLSPANQYEVKSLVKGEVLKAPFEEGNTVEKGELLYQISTSEIENSIKSAEIGVEKAELNYQDYLDKKDGLQITAAESGYIKKLYIKVGDTLQAGKTIADIYNEDVMYIELLFPSYEAKKSWVGKTASVIMDATQEVVKGEVTEVSSMEETMDGGILAKKVTIRVKNIGGIKAGDTAEVSIGDISGYNIGTFRAETETSIVAQTEGKIESLSVKEGQWITKGDKILSISSKDLDSQIESAELGITEAELSLETQKDQMKRYTIESPISGQIITKNKKQGDTIDPTSDTQSGPMAIVYDMSYLTFQMNIDELQISSIKEGQKVSITTESFPEDTFVGVIDRISLKGDTNNGVTNYPVIVKVEKFGNLLPGMNVTGKIIIDEADDVLIIPSSALQRDNIVYVKSSEVVQNDDPTIPEGFVPVTVKIGINDGSNVEIKEGLKEGDVVYVPFDTTVEMTENYYGY